MGRSHASTAVILLVTAFAQYCEAVPGPGIHPDRIKCILNEKLTVDTFHEYKDDIDSLWGWVCGLNRGIFVLIPGDGKTYSCNDLPEGWGVKQVADITSASPEVGLKALSKLMAAVYNTSADHTTACGFNGLTKTVCGREEPWRKAPWVDKLNAPIRGVNMGGLFVLESWILKGFVQDASKGKLRWGEESGIIDQHSYSIWCQSQGDCTHLRDHWNNFYTQEDFMTMRTMGLNTVRLPVGWWYFAELAGLSADPYVVPEQNIFDVDHPITRVIQMAQNAGLHVIMDLHGAPNSQNGLDNSGIASPSPDNWIWGETWLYDKWAVECSVRTLVAMARYISTLNDRGITSVMALELLNEPWIYLDQSRVRDFYLTAIAGVRQVLPDFPIIIHDSFRPTSWATLLKDFAVKNIYMDTHLYHGFNAADIASDSMPMDMMKQIGHENMACSYTTMLRQGTCSGVPIIAGEFSLAIDNCMERIIPTSQWEDWGQCNRISERLDSIWTTWWKEHIRSFAARQIATFEREMGWVFWTWKLDFASEAEPSGPFWSFRMAVSHGFIDTSYPFDACQHAVPAVVPTEAQALLTVNSNLDAAAAAAQWPLVPPTTSSTRASRLPQVGQASPFSLGTSGSVSLGSTKQASSMVGMSSPAASPTYGAGGWVILVLVLAVAVVVVGVGVAGARYRSTVLCAQGEVQHTGEGAGWPHAPLARGAGGMADSQHLLDPEAKGSAL